MLSGILSQTFQKFFFLEISQQMMENTETIFWRRISWRNPWEIPIEISRSNSCTFYKGITIQKVWNNFWTNSWSNSRSDNWSNFLRFFGRNSQKKNHEKPLGELRRWFQGKIPEGISEVTPEEFPRGISEDIFRVVPEKIYVGIS